MKLSNIYFKEFTLKEFCNNIEEEYSITEGPSEDLNNLIQSANKLIFSKFKIKPSDRVYFIAGSARLYIHQEIRDLFKLVNPLGDLDIVIPNKEIWSKAGLEKEYNNNGIYRPKEDDRIEAFNIWDPSKAGGQYSDVSVRPTNEILSNSNNIYGYYFMSLYDVIDYKISLNRTKEKEVVDLITRYNKSDSSDRIGIIRAIVKVLGIKQTKEFLGNMAK